MTLSLRFAAGSHKGMIREGNEDSGYAGPRLLAIADGMGGQAAGEVASSQVISALAGLDEDVPGPDILTSLGSAVQRANDQLRVMVEADPQLEGMGTTLTALLWTGQRLGLVHIGDSRAYLLRDGALTQITQDHTWVQRLVDEGRITEEEAGTHPQRSLLMRALDGRGQVEPDLSVREVRPGDRYMICSDGLSGVVSHQTLEGTLAGYQGPYETVQELIQLALRGGGPDNITCIVADVLDLGEADRPAAGAGEASVMVGAVAEHPGPHQHPAGHAADPGHGMASQPPGGGPDGAFGPPPGGDVATMTAPAETDTFGAYGEEPAAEGHAKPKKRRKWLRRSLTGAVVLGVLGGGVYGAYQWTQSQYYVGTDGDHVAVYQGISQNLLGLRISSVHQSFPSIELKYLPTYQRTQVQDTIAENSLSQALGKANDLQKQAAVCKLVQDAKSHPQTGATTGTTGQGTHQSTSASPGASPSLSPDDQKLAQQCSG